MWMVRGLPACMLREDAGMDEWCFSPRAWERACDAVGVCHNYRSVTGGESKLTSIELRVDVLTFLPPLLFHVTCTNPRPSFRNKPSISPPSHPKVILRSHRNPSRSTAIHGGTVIAGNGRSDKFQVLRDQRWRCKIEAL